MSPVVDAHVHVGRFGPKFFDPGDLGRFLVDQGVAGCVASATAAAVGLHREALRDLNRLMAVPGLAVWPLLWVTPGLLARHPALAKPLGLLPYAGLKIHPRANRWLDAGLERAFCIAEERSLPILVHTDDDPDSNPSRLAPFIARHPRTAVVMAHGRPVGAALDVLRLCPNAAVDTAFLPVPHLRRLLDAGFSSRILFGSDAPIDRCFHSGSSAARYRRGLKSICSAAPPDALPNLLFLNAKSIFFNDVSCRIPANSRAAVSFPPAIAETGPLSPHVARTRLHPASPCLRRNGCASTNEQHVKEMAPPRQPAGWRDRKTITRRIHT